MQKLFHFFSKNISIYTNFNDQNFNDTLTNDIVSFEQLGPQHHLSYKFRLIKDKRNTFFSFRVNRFQNGGQIMLTVFSPVSVSISSVHNITCLTSYV